MNDDFLRIRNDFFELNQIYFMRSLPNGDTCITVYLQLLLTANKYHTRIVDVSIDKLVSDAEKKKVESSLATLSDFGLIRISEDSTVYLENFDCVKIDD